MQIECEKPILAGVNGVAVGAGVSLAMNADIRIAAPSARFHPGYARVGLSPDLGLTWTLPRAIGYERAMRFLLEQRMVPASEALALGLVSEVVERDEDLEDRLLEYGTMLASVAPIAARQTKRLMVRADQPPISSRTSTTRSSSCSTPQVARQRGGDPGHAISREPPSTPGTDHRGTGRRRGRCGTGAGCSARLR